MAQRSVVRSLSLGLILACSILLAGCSSGADEISADDDVFSGLDPALVEEVLDSPDAQDRVAGDDQAMMLARYQGMVRNFAACRSALAVYQDWLETGTAPAFPEQPQPDNPVSTAEDMDRDIERFIREAESGDISLLRDELTNQSGCGVWIPAEPGDVDGPTIADVVNGKA